MEGGAQSTYMLLKEPPRAHGIIALSADVFFHVMVNVVSLLIRMSKKAHGSPIDLWTSVSFEGGCRGPYLSLISIVVERLHT